MYIIKIVQHVVVDKTALDLRARRDGFLCRCRAEQQYHAAEDGNQAFHFDSPSITFAFFIKYGKQSPLHFRIVPAFRADAFKNQSMANDVKAGLAHGLFIKKLFI